MMRRLIVVGAVVFSLSATASADEQLVAPRKMTLADCVAEAMHNNPDIKTAGDERAAASARRWEVGGNFGPRIQVDGNLQQWNGSYDLQFQLDPSQPAIPFHVRDALTWTVSAEAIQPLTGLLAIYEQYHMSDLGVDVAEIRRQATLRDIGFRVIEGYYRLLQSERLAEVAVTSVDQLNAQLKLAQSFHDTGVVSKDDVLRAELALASAKQRTIQSRAQVTLARSRLAVLMGLSPSTELDAYPLTGEPETTIGTSLESAESKALGDRVEVKEVDKEISSSKSGVRLAWLKMAPQVNLVANYTHTIGSPFSQKDAEFIGGTLSWDVWDWGSSIAGVKEANARMREAKNARQKLEDQVRLEVRESFLNLGSAKEGLDVAKAAVTSAEEHYRLVLKRYEANTTTSFDVVDAESLLTQARAQLQTSTYDFLVARAALKRATGDSPQAQQRP
ncbi:MAG TPA: TolC family protein [Polyangiaceae bacterium]